MEIVSIVRKIAARLGAPKPSEWLTEDLAFVEEFLGERSKECEKTGKPQHLLLMLRDCGAHSAILNTALERNTYPNSIFRNRDYTAPRCETYLIELDGARHPERPGKGNAAYGTLKRVPINTVKQIVEACSYAYKNVIVRYKTEFGPGVTLDAPDFDRDDFERRVGEITSVEPEVTLDIHRKRENALRQLQACAKPVKEPTAAAVIPTKTATPAKEKFA